MPATVFISYARGDDEPFVARLYSDLTHRGLDAWFDRVAMPSRGLSFLHEIRDAINACDRLLLVLGPNAVSSAYVTAEWRHAVTYGKVVNPILRLGDYPLIPDELKLLHIEDFRDDGNYAEHLDNLARQLEEPVPPMGKLVGVPGLPRHLLERSERLRSLTDAVLADLRRPVVVTGQAARVGVHGMGGIGKSVLANLLARDSEVRRAFPDGVFWVTLGIEPHLLDLQRTLARALGDIDPFDNVNDGKAKLKQLLADCAAMLVLDDVWDRKHAEAFDVLGERCRAVITTRDAGLVTSLGGVQHQVQLLSDAEGLRLLADAAELQVQELPGEMAEIVSECGRLPLALALCAGMYRQGHPWTDILARLRQAALDHIGDEYAESEQHASIWNAMKVSVDVLKPQEQQRFAELSVFAADEAVPESAVRTLWSSTGGLSKFACDDLLVRLNRRSLIAVELEAPRPGEAPIRRVSMHDLLHDLATGMAGDPPVLHASLIEAYRKLCKEGWSSGPDDGYFFQKLPRHLAAAREERELSRLVVDFRWLRAKLEAADVQSLLSDFDLLAGDSARELLRDALRLSAHVLCVHKGQLAAQLIGRLLGLGHAPLQKLLEDARRLTTGEWLRPLSASLEVPGGPLWRTTNVGYLSEVRTLAVTHDGRVVAASGDGCLRVWDFLRGECTATLDVHFNAYEPALAVPPGGRRALSSVGSSIRIWDLSLGICVGELLGHRDGVTALAVSAEGQTLASASRDRLIKIWDLSNQTCVHTLEGHEADINALAVSRTGTIAVSASSGSVLKVWDLARGCWKLDCVGHQAAVRAVAVSEDHQQALSASDDGTLKRWDLDTGNCIATLHGHTHAVSALALTADGRTAVSASADWTIKVWDLPSGRCKATFAGHVAQIHTLALTPDERYVISAADDSTIKVWDLSREQHATAVGYTNYTRKAALALTPDGAYAVAEPNGLLKVWSLSTRQCIGTIPFDPTRDVLREVALAPDGRHLIGREYDAIRTWDLQNGRCVATIQGPADTLHVFPEKVIACTRADEGTMVWNAVTGECIGTLKQQDIGSIDFTPDGLRALVASYNGTLCVWNIPDGQCIELDRDASGFHALAISPDGMHAVSSHGDLLKVWSVSDATCVSTLSSADWVRNILELMPGRRRVAWREGQAIWNFSIERLISRECAPSQCALAVASNGQRLISIDTQSARLWDISSAECLATVQSQWGEYGYDRLLVTPDGRHAVWPSSATLKVWELARGESGVLTLDRAGSGDFKLTNDSRYVVSASYEDRSVRVWELASGREIAAFVADSAIDRLELTPDDRMVIALEAAGRLHFLQLGSADYKSDVVNWLPDYDAWNEKVSAGLPRQIL